MTLHHIRRAHNPHITSQIIEAGHFDIYHGAPFEQVITAQIAFLDNAFANTEGICRLRFQARMLSGRSTPQSSSIRIPIAAGSAGWCSRIRHRSSRRAHRAQSPAR